MEGVFEDESQLRRCVENELLSDINISPEQALKVNSALQYYSTGTEIHFKVWVNTSYCGVGPKYCICCILFVSEVEGAAEAKIASSAVSAEDAGVSLGLSGFSHTT